MSDLPDGWKWVGLSDVCTSITDGDHQPPPQTSSGVPFLVIGNIRTGKLDFNNCRFVPNDYFQSLKLMRRPQKGDVLYSLVGSYGIPVLVSEDNAFCVQRHIGILRPSPLISPAFLAYLLSSGDVYRQATQCATGTAQLTIPLSGLRNFRIPLPPRQEQDRMVYAIEEQFSRLDAGLAALRRAHANANRLNTSILSLVSSNVNSWISLGEIAEVIGGVTKDKKKQADPALLEVPYLRVANVQRGYLDLRQVTSIRVPASTAQKLRLEPGDILFNEGGDRDKLGRGWIWEGQVANCIHQNHVFRARLQRDDFDPKFISMHGNSFGRSWFERMGKQTTNLASLNLKTLKSFPVPKISLGEQRAIVATVESKLSNLEALETEVATAISRSASLRSSILDSAFSGKLI